MLRFALPVCATLAATLGLLSLAGCGRPVANSSQPTPTVDLSQAREKFQSGGELTYEEVLAVKSDTIGPTPDILAFQDTSDYVRNREEHNTRTEAFARMLEKCRLKESIGWIAGWGHERTPDFERIPGVARIVVYMYDPYSGPDRDVDDGPDIYLMDINDKEATQVRRGQRIRFSGDLAWVDHLEAVRSVKYELLEDDVVVPTPTADELKELKVVLSRSMCFGSCPDYTLTITGDGNVRFEGRHYTRVKGVATATISEEKLTELVREIRKADFFNLSDGYSKDVTDHPTQRVSVHLGGQSKEVSTYASAPRRLVILQSRIDEIVNSAQWVRCGEMSCPE